MFKNRLACSSCTLIEVAHLPANHCVDSPRATRVSSKARASPLLTHLPGNRGTGALPFASHVSPQDVFDKHDLLHVSVQSAILLRKARLLQDAPAQGTFAPTSARGVRRVVLRWHVDWSEACVRCKQMSVDAAERWSERRSVGPPLGHCKESSLRINEHGNFFCGSVCPSEGPSEVKAEHL